MRAILLMAACAATMSITGCYRVKINAPPQSGAYVLGTGEQMAFTKVKSRCWYVFWGLLPVSDNESAEVIRKLPKGTRIVRVRMSLDSVSFFVSLFTLGIVGSSVIIVEGMAPPMNPGEHEIEPVPSTLPSEMAGKPAGKP
jgi:hypothetical protein